MKKPDFIDKDYIGINGVGIEQLLHPHFEIWQEYFKKEYKLKPDIKIVLFLPCAAIKPYYNSPIHRMINKVVDNYNHIQKFVISNAGVIPYEFCDKYPFESYDWNPLFETSNIKEKYIEITSQRIIDFFKNRNIKEKLSFISYLRNDSESLKSLKKAFDKLYLKLKIIIISGKLHETADTDLLLILKDNLNKLDLIINKILNQ